MWFLILYEIKGFLKEGWEMKLIKYLIPAPLTLQLRDPHVPTGCPASKTYLSSRTRPHDPFRSQSCCGSPHIIGESRCGTCELYPPGTGRCLCAEGKGGTHVSHQRHSHRNNRRHWSLWFLLLCFCMPDRPPKVPLTASQHPLAMLLEQNIHVFSETGSSPLSQHVLKQWGSIGQLKTGNRRPVHSNHCPGHSLNKYWGLTMSQSRLDLGDTKKNNFPF